MCGSFATCHQQLGSTDFVKGFHMTCSGGQDVARGIVAQTSQTVQS